MTTTTPNPMTDAINVWSGDGNIPPYELSRRRERRLARQEREARIRKRQEQARDRRHNWKAAERKRQDAVDRAREAYHATVIVGCERHEIRPVHDGMVEVEAMVCDLAWPEDQPMTLGTLIFRTPGPGNDTPMRLPIWNAFIGCTIMEHKSLYCGDDHYVVTLRFFCREHVGGKKAEALAVPFRDVGSDNCLHFSSNHAMAYPCAGDGHYNCEHCVSHTGDSDG